MESNVVCSISRATVSISDKIANLPALFMFCSFMGTNLCHLATSVHALFFVHMLHLSKIADIFPTHIVQFFHTMVVYPVYELPS